MTYRIHRMLMGAGLMALVLTTTLFSQPAEKYYLRLALLKGPKDSLALEIELRFWQEFREQAEKSETVKIVSGWDEIVGLLEYAEEISRTPVIFNTSKIENPAMTPPNLHVAGTIRRLRGEVEVDIQIKKIRTGVQMATGQARIPISTDPFPAFYLPVLRQLVQKLMAPLDPKIKKQKSWLGEPFDPEKINILVADFTNTGGEVDKRSKDVTSATFNKMDKFMKDDPALSEVVELKRLSSKGSGLVIREETRAKEIGEELNADMVIWGQNLCIGDSICVFAKALINHEARTTTLAEEGVLSRYQLLRADLPALIGSKANVLVKFIIGWTYLNDCRHQQFQRALKYLQQVLIEASADERQSILGWAAGAAFTTGQYELAIIWYTELEKRQTESTNRTGLAGTYSNIGSIYLKKGEFDKALEFYDKSEKIAIEVGYRASVARTYSNKGYTYYQKGEWGKALEYYDKSEKIGIELKDYSSLARTYDNIGLIYHEKGELDKALEYYDRSEKTGIEARDRASLAITYNDKGRLYQQKDSLDKALEYCIKSEKMRIEIGDSAGLAVTYDDIGVIYHKDGKFDKALEYYGKSEKIAIKFEDGRVLARVYNNIAFIHAGKTKWDDALQFLSKAKKSCTEVSDRALLVTIYSNIGLFHGKKGEWDEALESYREAEKVALEVQDRIHLAFIYGEVAAICRNKGEWEKVIQFEQRRLQNSISQTEQAQVQNLIGIGYIKQIKGDSAVLYLQMALQTFQQLGNKDMEGTAYNNLGSANKVRKDWPEALRWLRKSVAHNRAVAGDSASVLGFTYYHLADVFYQTNQPDSARYYVEKSLVLRQALGETENVKQTRELRERILSTPPRSGKK